jgi:hypothetical protein
MLGAACGRLPNSNTTAACRVSRIPSDAAIFASGEAVRSGRSAAHSVSTPTPTAASTAADRASAVGTEGPKKPWVSDQNTYPETIAVAPIARLIMPEPR